MPKTFTWGPVGVQMPRRGAAFDAATPQVLCRAYISAYMVYYNAERRLSEAMTRTYGVDSEKARPRGLYVRSLRK